MNAERLAAIEARANAAQVGPLGASGNYQDGGYWVQTKNERDGGYSHAEFCRESDAILYAHAREDVLALVTEVRRLRAIVTTEWRPGWLDER